MNSLSEETVLDWCRQESKTLDHKRRVFGLLAIIEPLMELLPINSSFNPSINHSLIRNTFYKNIAIQSSCYPDALIILHDYLEKHWPNNPLADAIYKTAVRFNEWYGAGA